MIRLTLMLLILAAPAQAAEMAFYLKNEAGAGIVAELNSRDREKVWPGGNKVYFLEPAENQFLRVECLSGEKICYGAWLKDDAGTHWGVGPEGDQQCTDCCFICEEQTAVTIPVGP